jgi:5-methylcytosine-specific restriction endonuclease McrA
MSISKTDKANLLSLYRGDDINDLWSASQNAPLIDHPTLGKVSPYTYRSMFHGKPCPFCGKKMVHGLSHRTTNKQTAIDSGYSYVDSSEKTIINQAGNTYFHPHYVTLDHKLNKARFPEQMFEISNLQIICWKCNRSKGDNNAFEILHSLGTIQSLADEALKRYDIL